jgi:hypothetical protein
MYYMTSSSSSSSSSSLGLKAQEAHSAGSDSQGWKKLCDEFATHSWKKEPQYLSQGEKIYQKLRKIRNSIQIISHINVKIKTARV